MRKFTIKTILATGVLLLVSACGTSEARLLVSDMKATSAKAQMVAEQANSQQAAYDTQMQTALGDLYVAYVRASWLSQIDSACADAQASALADYQAAIAYGQAQAKATIGDLGAKVMTAASAADTSLQQTEQVYTTAAADARQYASDGSLTLKAAQAQSAYLATAISVARIRTTALLTGYQGISDALDTFATSAGTTFQSQLDAMKEACDGARAQAASASVTALDLGGSPSDGNSLSLLATYAENMGTASDALDNYFNTNFSAGKGSFLGAFSSGLFGGLIHGSATPVTMGDIKSQGDALASGAVAWAKQAAKGLKTNVKAGLDSAKTQLVSTLATKANAAIKTIETRLTGGAGSTTAAAATPGSAAQ